MTAEEAEKFDVIGLEIRKVNALENIALSLDSIDGRMCTIAYTLEILLKIYGERY